MWHFSDDFWDIWHCWIDEPPRSFFERWPHQNSNPPPMTSLQQSLQVMVLLPTQRRYHEIRFAEHTRKCDGWDLIICYVLTRQSWPRWRFFIMQLQICRYFTSSTIMAFQLRSAVWAIYLSFTWCQSNSFDTATFPLTKLTTIACDRCELKGTIILKIYWGSH